MLTAMMNVLLPILIVAGIAVIISNILRKRVITDPKVVRSYVGIAAQSLTLPKQTWFVRVELDYAIKQMIKKRFPDEDVTLCPHVVDMVIDSGTVVARNPKQKNLYRLN